MRPTVRSVLSIALLVSGVLAGCRLGDTPDDAGVPRTVSFNDHVRPILSDNCFRCHGPDAGSREAGLRLDIPEAAYAELPESPGKHAIVAGSPNKSELLRRVTSDNPDERMPPPETHKVLSSQQIETLRRWIDQGAEYQPHWAYITPRRSKPPRVEGQHVVNDIDSYVLAQLEQRAITPLPEADRETLINRVTLDLTGLPPSVAEVNAFVADRDPAAYEKLVDRLLGSPRYGERMASWWMDIARYADSDGYLDDLHDRLFWPWRDWVISAFNSNMRYDQFVTWQLAGDLLPNPTREQLLATAFGRLGKRSTENGIIDEEYRVEYVNERAELVGKAFLGLTVSCAKCHDHKYDVISQKDYYSLGAFFNNIDERGFYAAGYSGRTVGPTLPWPDDSSRDELTAAKRAVASAQAAYVEARKQAAAEADSRVRELMEKPRQLESQLQASLRSSVLAYYPLDTVRRTSVKEIARQVPGPRKSFFPSDSPRLKRAELEPANGAPAPSPLPNGLVEELIQASPSATPGVAPAFLQEAVLKPGIKGQSFEVTDKNIGFLAKQVGWFERTQPFSFDLWLRLPPGKVYEDATIVNHRDHNVLSGDSGYTLNLDKNRLRFDLIHMSPHNMISVQALDRVPSDEWVHVVVTYDGSSRASGVSVYANGQPLKTEITRDNLTRTILPTLMQGALGGEYYGFAFGFRFRAELFAGGRIDELRLYDRALTPLEVRFSHEPAALTQPDRSQLDAGLREYVVDRDDRVVAAARALATAREAENRIASSIPEIMILKDAPTPRQAYLLERGLYNEPGEPVSAQGLERVFRWDSKLPQNRLGLVQWLFDKNNPMTARVTVNRLWAMHFGRGLVETLEDFGTQGSNPTHPELLDWLAMELIESGWDIKHIQKLMVMSATYRRSSDATQELIEKDPRNLLLARFTRQRMNAETIRDQALAVSGLLVPTIGGPSVRPYQPDGVWEAVASRHGYPSTEEVAPTEHHRRSMYTFIKRTATAPSMVVFDFADRNVCTVNRPVSNTPLQALVLLNDPQYREAYRALARRVLEQHTDEAARIEAVFRTVTRRRPDAQEGSLLARYYDEQLKLFEASPQRARAVTTIGVAEVDPNVDPVQWAALTSVVAAVMNTPDAYTLR